MNSVLVWVLVVSSWNESLKMANQLGPYASQVDCQRVQDSKPLRHFSTECVQVRIPTGIGGF